MNEKTMSENDENETVKQDIVELSDSELDWVNGGQRSSATLGDVVCVRHLDKSSVK